MSYADQEEELFGDYKYNDVPKLKAVFFCIFDNTKGPVIRHQLCEANHELDDYFGGRTFYGFSSALIPRSDLFNKIVKIIFKEYKLIAYPVGMDDDKYERGKLTFNMCFIVPRNSHIDIIYEPIVQKVAMYLVRMERATHAISNPKSAMLYEFMTGMFRDLNEKGEFTMNVSEDFSMYLKLCPAYRGVEPPKVALYMVPMWIRKVELTKHIVSRMDVLSEKVIPFIDGVRCVKEIAAKVDLDQDLVARVVRNLLFFESVSLMPLFLYSNTYVATEKIHDKLYRNFEERQKCIEFVGPRANVPEDPDAPMVFGQKDLPAGPLPQFADVFRLYISLKCGLSLKEWCAMNPGIKEMNIDVRRLIQFGMHRKFIRKLSVYPVVICSRQQRTRIGRLCDGTHALEDLAVLYGIAPNILHQMLKRTGAFEFISKG